MHLFSILKTAAMKNFKPGSKALKNFRVIDTKRQEPAPPTNTNQYGHRGIYDQVEAAKMGYGIANPDRNRPGLENRHIGSDPAMGGFAQWDIEETLKKNQTNAYSRKDEDLAYD